ncbi:LacI family DNA-binding transcriptional regulator [Brachybacterium sp. EE-P12]|uniref:LacI family DNA-binding transcriptional regulator n=1 Tax=Brachybacterium sp. EE-P12 TaxID=2306299 RepID=UPI000F07FA14|nr:LacI family DNA-binding transcriptional regulator [Brachybacterium sp. EE-P12]
MSISAVAREAGVSTSTVSRFLKGELRVSPETEARIRTAMGSTGFTAPRSSVRHVALIIPELSNPYFAQLTQAITDAAHHRDIEVSVLVSDGLEAREHRMVSACAQSSRRGADAILFVSMTGSGALLSEVPENFPFVVIDEKLDGELAEARHFVGADNFEGSYRATTYLLSQGHRRIAHLAGPERLGSARDRLRGYLRALRDAGLATDPQLVLEGPYSESFGASALSRILRLDDPPTAVFAASDIVAVGLSSAAPMHGISIPAELSLIGFDGIEQGAWVTPQLSSVVQPLAEIAKQSLDLLRTDGTQTEPTVRLLPMELKIAGSVGASTSSRS